MLNFQNKMKPHFVEQNRSYLQWCLSMLRPSKGLDVIALKVLRMLLNVSKKNTTFLLCMRQRIYKNNSKRLKCANASTIK